jgi:lipoprotein-anchoring transpeptidase ErfK/SrfK
MQDKNQSRITTLVIAVNGGVAVAALVCLLAFVAFSLLDSPVQAALPEPTPTTYVVPAPPTVVSREGLPTSTPEPAAPEPAIVAGVDGANVRSGPGTSYDRLGYLTAGTRVEVTGWHGEWWQVTYAGRPAWVYGLIVTPFDVEGVPQGDPPPAPTAVHTSEAAGGIDEERWIDVDLSEQVLTAYESSVPVYTTLVSSGLPATPTPIGRFRIWIRLRFDDMAGDGYYLEDVPFVMYFYEGYALHGVTWHGNFGHPMSHGCVNLPTDAAEWLYFWADVGTLVNVHE